MIGQNICDKRREVSLIEKDFPEVDYSNIESNADALFTPLRETIPACVARGYEFLMWLRQRKEKSIAVVCHSSFLLVLFNGVLECQDSNMSIWFEVAECRSVRLVFSRSKPPGKQQARMLKELESGLNNAAPTSRRRNRGAGSSLTAPQKKKQRR
jgi:hypothetical protein